jgi:23S rRNA pseudouridine1911/1915/1917 synthase
MSEGEKNPDENFLLKVTEQDRENFKRLDLFLVNQLPQFSRSTIKRLFEDEDITSPDRELELKKMPPVGTVIEVEIPPPIQSELVAEKIPLEILYEDSHLIIVNKPAGLVVHPAPGHCIGCRYSQKSLWNHPFNSRPSPYQST